MVVEPESGRDVEIVPDADWMLLNSDDVMLAVPVLVPAGDEEVKTIEVLRSDEVVAEIVVPDLDVDAPRGTT